MQHKAENKIRGVIATLTKAQNFSELLDKFEAASRQKVNPQKSSIFFSSNSGIEMKRVICSSLGMQETNRDILYLGLPSMMGRNKLADRKSVV